MSGLAPAASLRDAEYVRLTIEGEQLAQQFVALSSDATATCDAYRAYVERLNAYLAAL